MWTPCLSRGLGTSTASVSELSIEILVTRAGREPLIYLRVTRLLLSSTAGCGSVVVAVEPVADALIEKIVSRMDKLRTGDGRRGCDMGPLVTKEHRDKVAGYIDVAIKDGAKVVVDGRDIKVDGEGFWGQDRLEFVERALMS